MEQIEGAFSDRYQPGTAIHSFLTGKSGKFEDGGMRYNKDSVHVEIKAGVGIQGGNGITHDTLTGVSTVAIQFLANNFAKQMVDGLRANKPDANPAYVMLVEQLKFRNKESKHSMKGDFWAMTGLMDAAQKVSEAARDYELTRQTWKQAAQAALTKYEVLNPGSRSYVMAGWGLAVALGKVCNQARVAWSLGVWHRGRQMASRAWQTSPEAAALALVGLTVQAYIVVASGKTVSATFESLAANVPATLEWLAKAVLPHLGMKAPGVVLAAKQLASIVASSVFTGAYARLLSPYVTAWYGSREARTLVRNSRGGRGFLPNLPEPTPAEEGIGWFTRSTVQANDNKRVTSTEAKMLTEYAVEIAALMCVGELRDCSDALNLEPWSATTYVASSVRAQLKAEVQADGALLEGIGQSLFENAVPTERQLKDAQETIERRITTTLATRDGRGNVKRVGDPLQQPSKRFEPIRLDEAPRAVGAYAALFGRSTADATSAARPVVPLAHATLVRTGVLDQVHVSDALRGAVCGAYDGGGAGARAAES